MSSKQQQSTQVGQVSVVGSQGGSQPPVVRLQVWPGPQLRGLPPGAQQKNSSVRHSPPLQQPFGQFVALQTTHVPSTHRPVKPAQNSSVGSGMHPLVGSHI